MSNRYKIEYRLYKDMGAASPGVYTLWDGNAQQISDAVVKTEINKAGSFDFTIYPAHDHYDKMIPRLGFVTVYDMGGSNPRLLFNGQVRTTQTGLYGEKTVHCEGDLGLLNDWYVNAMSFDELPDSETPGSYYPGLTAEQAMQLIFGQTVNITTYETSDTSKYYVPMMYPTSKIEISKERYMQCFRSFYSKGVEFATTTQKTTVATKIVKNGSVIIPTLSNCDYMTGLMPWSVREGTALQALNDFLKNWPGRIEISYPVDLWHPVFTYTQQANVPTVYATQPVQEGLNILDLDITVEPEDALVTYITPIFRAWYITSHIYRTNGEETAWRQPGTPVNIASLQTEYGTRNGSPREVKVWFDFDKMMNYLDALPVDSQGYFYTKPTGTVVTALDNWYRQKGTDITEVTFNDVCQIRMNEIMSQFTAWLADHTANDLFLKTDNVEIDLAEGTEYNVKVVDLSLVAGSGYEDAPFEVGTYAQYKNTDLLVESKTVNLFEPQNNTVDLNSKKSNLTDYLSKAGA